MPLTQIPRPFLIPKTGESRPGASNDRDLYLVASLAALTSIAAFVFYYLRGEILLYGDAIGHINIARRVFDSRTPGISQLGTVWLPLPHLAILPFVISNWMWRTGVGGSIPSMAAYVAGSVGLYRLVRRGLSWSPHQTMARIAAWSAALIYAANPSILYLQATAMTEVPYLAFFIWAAVFFTEFVQQGKSQSLIRCALMLLCCTLTRYDGWFALALFGAAALAVVIYHRGPWKVFRKAAIIAALGPLFWLGWNTYLFKNPLEFANGPYSARAIAERGARPSDPHYPGWHNPSMAARQFIKSTRLTLAGDDLRRQDIWPYTKWHDLQNLWFPVAAAGTLLLIAFAPWMWPWLLLWTPLPFYALSIAYGSVPIFLPSWWPYSFYNVRYGTQLLPAVAVFVSAAAFFISTKITGAPLKPGFGLSGSFDSNRPISEGAPRRGPRQAHEVGACWGGGLPGFGKPGSLDFVRTGVSAGAPLKPGFGLSGSFPSLRCAASACIWLSLAALLVASYAGIWKHTPIALREAQANSIDRAPFERQLAAELKKLPANSTILMYMGEHVGALQQIAMPLRRTINETTFRLWDAALANPARYAQFAVATDDDPVAQSIRQHAAQFQPIARVEHDGQKAATIYRAVSAER
jgi:hypothetical protein